MVATLAWLLVCLIVLVSANSEKNLTGITLPSEATQQRTGIRNNYTRKQVAAITKQFVNYYLYFGEKVDTLYNNGGLSSGVCFAESFSNETYQLLSNSVKSSVREEFVNRVLTKEQISWRNKSYDKVNKTTPSSNSGTSSIDKNQNSTSQSNGAAQSVQNTTTSSEPTENENDNDKNNKIHNHLIFVMLLPHHPYSQEVRKIITTVTPLFPQATIVLGNAYEFKDMITKYYVTSFPKILYFRSGIYLEAFEGVYSAEDVAAQLADWTYSLPQAVPLPFARTQLARRTARSTRQFDIYAPNGQMRYGLALQPLPLTVQYTLLNFSLPVPGWLAQYMPWLVTVGANNSTRVISDDGDVSDLSAVIMPDGSAISTSVADAAPRIDYVESVTGSDGTSVQADESVVEPKLHHFEPTDSIVDTTTTHGTPTLSIAHVPAHSTYTTHDVYSTTDIPIQLSITVPMPNVEPFLGSLENYAVWDTRMFLLAGLYVIVRVLFLLLKWMQGGAR